MTRPDDPTTAADRETLLANWNPDEKPPPTTREKFREWLKAHGAADWPTNDRIAAKAEELYSQQRDEAVRAALMHAPEPPTPDRPPSEVLPPAPAAERLPSGGLRRVAGLVYEALFPAGVLPVTGRLAGERKNTIVRVLRGELRAAGWRRADAGEAIIEKLTDALELANATSRELQASLATTQAELAALRGAWVAGPPKEGERRIVQFKLHAGTRVATCGPSGWLTLDNGEAVIDECIAHWTGPCPTAYAAPAESAVGRG